MSVLVSSGTSTAAALPACTVLLVDDDPMQLKLCAIRLADAGFAVETASGADEAVEKARTSPPDAIVSDVIMGDLDGFALCLRLREVPSLASVPVILLSAHFRDEAGQQLATRVGASALVTRTPEFDAEIAALRRSLAGKLPPIGSASDASLYEQHLRTSASQMSKLVGQARVAEERYRALFQNANDTITVLTADGVIVEANERWREVLGIAPEEMIGRHIREFSAPGHEEDNVGRYRSSIASGRGHTDRVTIRRPDGKTISMAFSNTLVEVDGGGTLVFAIGRDVTEEVVGQEALAAAELKYRSLVERMPDVVWTCAMDGGITFITRNVERVLGWTPEEMYAEGPERRTASIHRDDRATVAQAFAAFIEHGKPFDLEYRCSRKDGQWIWVRDRAVAVYERDGVRYAEGMLSDVTERRRLEDSLRQAQKMEAIGQLTGGIAHDFNNMLAAILANSHFLIEELADHDPRRADAEEIRAATERAASLTRQLLAFSRRQILEPTIIDLDATVRSLQKMLRRLIRENIEFSVSSVERLGSVRVDVGQLEQVVMNLVVNARDAMPEGGRLAIETANVDLDETETAQSGSVPAGRYVMLAVSDTGCGMDAATRSRIFEPFFTTKEVGVGTGLGLSTCYGIVKQSGGFITVYSEPGHGTTFKIYLPRVDETPDRTRKQAGRLDLGGTETILVVEDDDRIRTAVCRMLAVRGYRLVTARNGTEALEAAGRHEGPIHLVLSDVILPGASGPQVVAEVQACSPGVKALFMSGYTDRAVLSNGSLAAGMSFLQKPFAPETLSKKVREVLDG